MQPLRILDLRDSPWVDGPGRTILQTAQAIDASSYVVVVGSFCREDASNVYLDQAVELGLETLTVYERRAFDPHVVSQIAVAIDSLSIDIVHCHEFRTNVAGLLAARRCRVPVISTCHGWIANNIKGAIYRSVDMRLLRRFDQVIAVSRAIETTLIENGVSDSRISVIENALVTNDFRPNAGERSFRRELGLSDTSVLMGKIGRLSPEKGHCELLECFAAILQQHRDVYLAIVGIGPERDRIERHAEDLSIRDNVRFVGYQEDMQRVYNGLDLVVQSSRTEGMPNVILEALIMQKPVIATNVGGTAEIVHHGETGYLVKLGAKEELIAAMQQFLENRSLFEQMAEKGSKIIPQRFNHTDRVQRIASLYSKVARRGTS